MEKKNYYTIAALAKAFGIIETMACKGQWKLKELADMSKLPKGTLQRILLTLCELGYVQQSREGGEYSDPHEVLQARAAHLRKRGLWTKSIPSAASSRKA